MEMLLSDSIIWLWGLDWSINSEDLAKHFTQVSFILTSCSFNTSQLECRRDFFSFLFEDFWHID
jgi:hypothetical protein